MFYYIISIVLLLVYLLVSVLIFKISKRAQTKEVKGLEEVHYHLLDEVKKAESEVVKLEEKIREVFFVYEVTRDFSLHLDKNVLLDIFRDKLKYFGSVGDVLISDVERDGYLNYELGTDKDKFISIKTSSPKVGEYISILLRQFRLCMERIQLYEKMQYLSIYDFLTQIPNRRHFMTRFYDEFDRSRKFKLSFSLLMGDIDYFKKVNDTYGHIVGDAVLGEISRILMDSVREIDFVARYGGEEFAILLPETDKGGAILVGERIVRGIASQSLKVFDERLNVTISIGVATYPENTFHSDILIETADKALYKAKQEGRNRVGWF